VILTEARGEAVQTVELSSGTVDSKGCLDIVLRLDGKLESEGSRGTAATISIVILSVPERAEREYAEAQRCLSRQDEKAAECAAVHLRQAVQIAPRFTAAWNQMGTIAYQTRRYSDAETDFRKALEGDPLAFEPMVNLGGVLLNLERPREALEYNKQAAARRPNDALANSQLGMTWLALNDSAQAEKYLKIAVQLDPAHFSHPQLSLAALYVARGDGEAALLQLRDFLQRHPDSPEADKMRREIRSLSK
jgi:tetratricopeptide (TPR) repeat protein